MDNNLNDFDSQPDSMISNDSSQILNISEQEKEDDEILTIYSGNNDNEETVNNQEQFQFMNVWVHFTRNVNQKHCVCNVANCGQIIKGLYTTNCIKHLRAKHKDINVPSINNNQRRLKSMFGYETTKKFTSTHPMQKNFEKYLAILVGSEPVPFNMVEKKSFRKMIAAICPSINVPYRPALLTKIVTLEVEMKEKVKSLLTNAAIVNIIIDLWTKKGMTSSYIGVMAIFYSSSFKDKKCLALAVRSFEGDCHTWERINSKTFKILKEYNVGVEKILRIITDNGSNMVKAFTMSNHAYEDLDFTHDDTIFVTNMDNNTKLLRCFIHSMLLELKKVENDFIIGELIAKLKDFVKAFKSSSKLSEALKVKSGKSLISFCNTRWNYIFLVIQRLIEVKDELNEVLDESMSNLSITEDEWILIESLKPFLELFWNASNSSSREKTVEISEVIPTLRDLMNNLSTNEYPIFANIRDSIISGLKKRFSPVFDPTNAKFDPIFITATWLDPRYRRCLTENEVSQAKRFILSIDFIDTDYAAPEIPCKQTKFACANVTPDQISLQKPQLKCEIEQWHTDPSYHIYNDYLDLILYWNDLQEIFKLLSNIALNVLSVPSSSACVERLFSIASYACSSRRNRLEGDNLEREVLLSKNSWLFDQNF